MALETSCKSILLTMSKVFSGMMIYPKTVQTNLMRVPEEAELTPWNFFFVRFSQSEKAVEIAGCHASDFFGRNTAQFAQLAGDFLYECRFVPLASMRNGRQKGRVGFNKHAIKRHLFGCIANGLRFGKSDISGEGNHEA